MKMMMKERVRAKVGRTWPTWFNIGGDFRYTGMTLGFRHDDGWFHILWRLCEDLEPLIAEFEQGTGRQFEILQVKEKFGGLRIYVNDADDNICLFIETAQLASSRTCEVCGQPGTMREGGWIRTLCDQHATAAAAQSSVENQVK
jgi:hypothetical protein